MPIVQDVYTVYKICIRCLYMHLIAVHSFQALSDDTTPVDVLINCAGITHTASLVDTPTEKYKV